MLTKTRTAIITLVAAGSFATATVAPAVSQAQDNGLADAWTCEVLKEEAEENAEVEDAARKSGHKDLARYYQGVVASIIADAETMNCAWATPARRDELKRPPVAEVTKTTPVQATAPLKEAKAPIKGVITSAPPATTTPPVVVKSMTLAKTAIG